MQVTHRYRVWDGRCVIERGSDSNSSVYTDLQRFGFHWIMPFIVVLERRRSIDPPHPSGRPWCFQFLIDYRKGRNTPPTSAQLRIVPELRRNFCISIPLDPKVKLSLSDVEYHIKQYVL